MIDLSYLRDQSQAPCTYLPKLNKKFLRAEGSVHFRVENIYGRELPFFTRFMPTNGFVQPFVGIISFLSVFHGGDKGIRTPDLLHAKQALSQLSYIPKLNCTNIIPQLI